MAQLKAVNDKLLTAASNALIPTGYISELLLPMLGVKEQSGKLAKYGKDHLRIVNTVMAGKGKAPFIESMTRSSTSYYIEPHGLTGIVTDEDYKNVTDPYNAEKDETLGLTTLLWLAKEKALADAVTSTAIITQNTTLVGNAKFSDYSNSDPIGVAKTARLTVRSGCGLPPNCAAMDWAVANTLAYHPGILEALGYTQNRAGQLSDAELAKALGVEKLLIGKAVYNSAVEGQTDSVAAVWGKHILFCYAPDTAGKYQQSLGYHVKYEGEGPRTVFKQAIFNPPGATEIVVTDKYDMLLSDVTCAYLIENAIA